MESTAWNSTPTYSPVKSAAQTATYPSNPSKGDYSGENPGD
jgi:hypothetical protein